MSLPSAFAQTIREVHGEAGEVWLERLPALLETYAERWGLTLAPPYALSYNYVVPAVRADGTRVVLKAGVPHPELWREIEALQLYNGDGIARLLEADSEGGIFLLERLEPGTSLVALVEAGRDEEATQIAAEVMRKLWRPLPAEHGFRPIAEWVQGMAGLREAFGGGVGPFPPLLVERAETTFREFLAEPLDTVLLHGDLHQGNILSAQRAPWLAIDPKGMTGERGFELGAFLHEPLPQLLELPHPERVLERRVALFAERLEMERERIRGWGMAHCVLSAWWSYEDHEHLDTHVLQCGEYLMEGRR